MADMPAPKASSTSAHKSDSNTLGGTFGVLKLPSTGPIPRGRAATIANSSIAKAAQEHGESEKEVGGDQKRVKKVNFTKKTKAKTLDNHTPTSASPTFTTPTSTTPAFKTSAFTTSAFTTPTSSSTPNVEMTEVRARAARHKGQMNFEAERTSATHSLTPYILLISPPVTQALYAFGDDKEPLPETVRVLDEIVTDYIIETCFHAAKSAEICGRSKLKVDDFKWAIRGDPVGLGRVNELLAMDKHISTARKAFKTDEGREGLERGGRKKKGDTKDGEEKVTEDKVDDKGLKEEDKVEEDLGDLDDEDME